MFYHDHAWGITRLNVYAGEAAGYLITDPTEQKLFGPSGTYADMGEGIPLVIQDRTFVPSAAQLAEQDPTWDASRWGGMGNLWYHHVYMPAQNPGDPSGMSAYGRWMYGPWFWPPATPVHGPIANPYYDKDPRPTSRPIWPSPATSTTRPPGSTRSEPFCEPALIPGTPNISVGMEQFNDTPDRQRHGLSDHHARPEGVPLPHPERGQRPLLEPVRGTSPTRALAPSEVALKAVRSGGCPDRPQHLPDARRRPSAPRVPSWIQIGTEGGFLPAPAVVPTQPITWITDPTRFDVGNVDKHSLLLGARRAGRRDRRLLASSPARR